ncbi:hypothetical protein [Succiniclasticum ruminis]|uniref:Uncharacterized protein n=1 Tax=Succiniclasticum ruminis DSM 9236 TaxID=1123323 RepID=A0A1I1YC13_9FIRM|nr:hypothetical protein [Succiniclasticum ruminis]SFE17137.1 hypothetical protein SAMN05216245_102136 [Succiniclasticum ruminis DSM 9236]
MAVIYLNRRRKLTEEQKRVATSLLHNEVNEVMADLEIIEDSLDRTFLFGELNLRELAEGYIEERLKTNPDGSYDEELLKRVYNHYFGEQKGE